jgi:hypothetical protein
MKYCSKCKSALADDDILCPGCGQSNAAPGRQPAPPPSVVSPPVVQAPAPAPVYYPQTPPVYYTQAPPRPLVVVPVKSYIGWAFITLILYYLGFYVVGAGMNIYLLLDAGKNARETGRWPSGRGCLWSLFIVHWFVIPVILIIFITVAIYFNQKP